MDLTNVLSPAYIRSHLASFESLKGQQVDLDKLVLVFCQEFVVITPL